ncbi:MAG: hypothetical protein FJ150_05980 [Euryarchaeota archaeon]|nr:hypothetical protein [Euryarchaeota archaeon]
MTEPIKEVKELDKSYIESKSKELRKFREIETVLDEYVTEIGRSRELNVLNFSMEMGHIIIFLAENDKEGILFNLLTDYLTKIIDKGKIIRQEKGL